MDKKFLIIPGVQKAGTTTLWNALVSMDETTPLKNPSGDPVKETHFFALEEDIIKENVNWYKSFCKKKSKLKIDSCPNYITSKKSGKMISDILSDVIVVILIRDPIIRSHSSYLYLYRNGNVEKRRFKDIVRELFESNGEDLRSREEKLIIKSLEGGKLSKKFISKSYLDIYTSLEPPFYSHFEDNLWPYRYFYNSIYSDKIHLYENEGIETEIVFMEEMIERPSKIISNICNKAGIKSHQNISLPHSNKTYVPRKSAWFIKKISKFVRRNGYIDSLMSSKVTELAKKYFYKDRKESWSKLPDKTKKKCTILLKDEYRFWIEKYPRLKKYWKDGYSIYEKIK